MDSCLHTIAVLCFLGCCVTIVYPIAIGMLMLLLLLLLLVLLFFFVWHLCHQTREDWIQLARAQVGS